jgi:hypothetical protein
LFNTDLPSGRRRLFFLVLLVFTIAGFSAKYLLIKQGWVGGQREMSAASPQASQPVVPEPVQTDGPGYSFEELREAEQFAGEYIRIYGNRDPRRKDEWLNKLRPFTAQGLYETLRTETEEARPVDGDVVTTVKQVGRVTCSQNGGAVSCLVECVMEERNATGGTVALERVYDLQLTRDEADWLVQEVAVRGSFE